MGIDKKSGLVDQFSDNPAAKMTAQGIAERVGQAERPRGLSRLANVNCCGIDPNVRHSERKG